MLEEESASSQAATAHLPSTRAWDNNPTLAAVSWERRDDKAAIMPHTHLARIHFTPASLLITLMVEW